MEDPKFKSLDIEDLLELIAVSRTGADGQKGRPKTRYDGYSAYANELKKRVEGMCSEGLIDLIQDGRIPSSVKNCIAARLRQYALSPEQEAVVSEYCSSHMLAYVAGQ